jgi:aminopeptidase N
MSQRIHRKDYKSPSFQIPKVLLDFTLDEASTVVKSSLYLERCNEGPLILDGINLGITSICCDGKPIEYTQNSDNVIIDNLPDKAVLSVENLINPKDNLSCMGLYKSGDIMVTQMEPDGFRRCTLFPDRPDVMSKYTVTARGSKELYPVLLSNGNRIEYTELPNNFHQATFIDPFPKPCYLFALVAGKLEIGAEHIWTTKSGRQVILRIYVERGDEHRCNIALNSLISAIKWDEDVYNLEYDLDVFSIVATQHFNFGAMENKSLNIFNAQAILADESSATDNRIELIESIVAHEYFHNWSGNRVTCRDWFQLTLKEGLTVYRDQEFSADSNNRAVKRIQDVGYLREKQFPEDESPNAHSIRPDSFFEVENFYTATIYSKGAEVIRMCAKLLGQQVFLSGINRFFNNFDGQAVTIEDFYSALTEVSGFDFTQFKNWYNQIGTPSLEVISKYDSKEKRYHLTFRQDFNKNGAFKDYRPYQFPVEVSLLNPVDKTILPLKVTGDHIVDSTDSVNLIISEAVQSFVFEEVPILPIPSLLRDFSAPLNIHYPYHHKELLYLLANDTNMFNRYEAANRFIFMFYQLNCPISADFLSCLGEIISDSTIDPGFLNRIIDLPAVERLAASEEIINFDKAYNFRETVFKLLGIEFADLIIVKYYELRNSIVTKSVDRSLLRRVRNCSIHLLNIIFRSNRELGIKLAKELFDLPTSMTDELGALKILLEVSTERELALKLFYQKWSEKQDVLPVWFGAQVASHTGKEVKYLSVLENHPSFDKVNPNFLRSLYLEFVGNSVLFHNVDGTGYNLIAEKIIKIDNTNPWVAAQLAKSFLYYPRLDDQRKSKVTKVLNKILSCDISTKVREIVENTLNVEFR